LARFNRRVTNRVLPLLLRDFPGFAIVNHAGRTSGRRYRTPVLLFERDGRFVVALTYGPVTDWVQNVLAAGGCVVEQRDRLLELGSPRLYRDPARHSLPSLVRAALRLLGVVDFLELVCLPRDES
jgi:deazaflavin-dependent oxidoreductase (nitroreductase family)